MENKKKVSKFLQNPTKSTTRDHRIIGKQLDLYHMQEEAPGVVFWHNNGWIIFQELIFFIRKKLQFYNYQEVKSPLMIDKILWEKTGHLDNYSEQMFSTFSEKRKYCIKPMNCPGHIQIFNQGIKSYRDLPFRIAEFGSCYRNEPSGALHGLMRLREFTQDDAHIFCTKDQVQNEIKNCINMVYDIYHAFGFKKIIVNLSTRPKNRIGDDAIWNWSEKKLASALFEKNIAFRYQYGEGAFYGPKIEFVLLDCLNRYWQCGTIQLDFFLPYRLNSFYIGKENTKLIPIIIHRAILGSIERFIGILTEEYAGFYPTWLSPIQVVLINITDNQLNYVKDLTRKFLAMNIRAKADLRNEKIGFKIREHTLNRIPYMLICGDREVKFNEVTVRTRSGKDLGNININTVMGKIKKEINNYDLNQLEK